MRSAGSGTAMRARRRRNSSACQRKSGRRRPPVPSSSRPAAHARTISGRCSAYRSKRSARWRTTANRRARRVGSTAAAVAPRCVARLSIHGSSRHPSTTSRRAQTERSGSHGSVAASMPEAVATASPTRRRGDGKATFAHTPSARPGVAPSRPDMRWLSHRSIPRVGTATTSRANGSAGGSASRPASASTRASARSARWTWSTAQPSAGPTALGVDVTGARSRAAVRAAARHDPGRRHKASVQRMSPPRQGS